MILSRKHVAIVIALLPVVAFVIGQGCSDTKLGKIQSPSQAAISFCTTPAQQIQNNLKYIFVFDHSGSNQQNYVIDPNTPSGQTPVPVVDPMGPTDPDGSRRFPPLINFMTNITDNANTFYSIVDFSNSSRVVQNWITGGNRTTAAQTITNLNNLEWHANGATPPGPIDGGDTNYESTLTTIRDMIVADVTNTKNAVLQNGAPIVASDYVIFWVSDGAPYVTLQLQPLNTILSQIQSLEALRGDNPEYIDSIMLNTGFYHNYHDPNACAAGGSTPTCTYVQWGASQDQTALNYMSQMALTGQGIFLDFSSVVIDYTKFSVPIRTAKFMLKDVWIQNVNTMWWGGKLMADADGDGLPDEIELQLGSNPLKYDSDGNGVGDGVEYYLYGSPCQDAKCSATNARQWANCQGIKGRDTDGDFLNDCEELLLGSKPDDFDSTQHYLPDEFAWVSGLAFLPGTNDLPNDPDGDGVTNYFELKHNSPVNYDNKNVPNLMNLTYTTQQISDNASQTCYQLNVNGLAVMSNQDLIRVYVMEARGAVGSHRVMRVAQKKSLGGLVVMKDSDFVP